MHCKCKEEQWMLLTLPLIHNVALEHLCKLNGRKILLQMPLKIKEGKKDVRQHVAILLHKE
jgi:hypothetical protein